MKVSVLIAIGYIRSLLCERIRSEVEADPKKGMFSFWLSMRATMNNVENPSTTINWAMAQSQHPHTRADYQLAWYPGSGLGLGTS